MMICFKKIINRLPLIMFMLIVLLTAGGITAYGAFVNEIVFVDDALEDYKMFMDSTPEGVQIVVLDGQQDGIEQMAEYLKDKNYLDAIHIISHGDVGEISVGTAVLNSQTIESYLEKLDIIGQSLNGNGDILLYGCDVASGESGKQFVEDVARITDADVAASEDATGSAAQGGNWVLEYQTGIIDTKSDLFSNMDAYPFLLEIKEDSIQSYAINTWAFSSLAVGQDGTIYLAHKVSGTEIAVKYWNGTSWISLTSITTADTGDTGLSDDLDLAVDSENKLHIAFRRNIGTDVTSNRGVKYGFYNGTSWEYSDVEAYSHPSGWKNFDDPEIAVDSEGAAHMVYLYRETLGGGSTNYNIQYATNHSGSWVISTLATGESSTDEIHNPRIVIDENDIVHVSYVREDNQNDYYGNYYYTSKGRTDAGFPLAQKLIDAVSEGKSYSYSPLVSDASALYFTYCLDDWDLVESTSYLYSNQSGSWQREQVYFDDARFTSPVGVYTINSNLYLLMDSTAEDWSENYYFAMANYGSGWITGTETIIPTLLADSGYASEIRFIVDAEGDFMLVIQDGPLMNLGSLTGTSADFGLSIPVPSDVEITGFDAISNVSAGTAGSATYADAAAVIAELPTTVTANTNAVTVTVNAWEDTDTYNPAVAGSYTFTAILEDIPSGYANLGGYTATVEVVVSAPTYGVTYNDNGSTGGAVPTDGTSYHTMDTATVLGNTGSLVRTGYTFAGWNTLANGSGTDYAPEETFEIGSSNVTLYAQWTAVDYTVTYHGNANTGGAVPVDGNTYSITDNATVLGNTGGLVRTGYTFAGWNTLANGTGTDYAPAATFAIGSSNVTLYAKWTENVYTITYNDNGSTGGAVPTDGTSYHTMDTATVLGNTGSLVRTGYTFAGWNTLANGSGTDYAPEETFVIGSSNVTLYAQWTAVDYTVTYHGNANTGGAVPVDGNTYSITDNATVLGNTGSLVRTGYTFAGWNTLANGTGTDYAPAATFAIGSSNVVLYAKWTENVYTITYNDNGSTGGAVPTDGTSYHTMDTATVLGNTGSLVRTGYTFAGWNTLANDSGTDYAPEETFVIGSSNVTLYAQWTAVDYTVTYHGNANTGGAVPVDGNTYSITDNATVLGNTGGLVRTGYTFAGWNTLANGTGTDYAPAATFAIGSSNVTLYAKWNVAVSSDATLKASSTVKGQIVTSLGTPNATLGSETSGAVTITAAKAADTSNTGSFCTLFDKNDINATVKAVKYASGATDFSVFDGTTAYTNGTITDGDFFIVRVTAEDGTTINYYRINVAVTPAPSTAKAITAFNFNGLTPAVTGTVNEGAKTIALTVPYGTDVTALVPTITHTGASVSPNTGVAQDFTHPLDYTVTSADNSSQEYTVTVTVAANTATAITSFKFNELTPAVTGLVDEGAKTIALTVPHGTDVTALVPTITHTGTSIFPNTGVAQNFTTPVSYTVTFTDSSTQDYTATVSVGASSNSNLSALSISYGTLSPAFESGTTSYIASVGNTYSSITVTPTVADGNATVKVNGLTVTSGSATGEINLSVGNNIITVVVTAQDGTTSNTYAITVTRAASSGGSGGSGGSSGGSSSTTTTQPSQNTSQNTVVVVNGKEQNAGKETKESENGKTIVTVAVDNKAIESKIDEAIKTNTTGIGNVIQIPVSDTKSDVVKVELTGDIVKKLEENTFDVSVKRDNIEYIIPASEFTISKVAENLGIQEKALADIKVEVKITKLDEKVVEKYNEVAKTNGAELVFPPVQFEITANTTNIDGTTKVHSINKFSNYVERVMEIPASVDRSKITTGIVFNADGTYSHVPTEVYEKDGKLYAKLNSLTNSDYSIIWNPVIVKSVENHWAKESVNDMASRLIMFNAEEFEPDKAITRADFAEYIVRALGLYREGSVHENNFKDVSAKGERTLAILIANEYGIVSGYSDGTFRGDNQITREEAMVMYQRAMNITKLVGSDDSRCESFTDYSQVSDWAKTNVRNVLSAHVFNGTTTTTISPKASLTYAESAQAIKNLLVESKLISQ